MKHPTKIAYKGGLEKLVEDIGNLRYDTLAEFLELLQKKLDNDSKKDGERGRKALSLELSRAATFVMAAKESIDKAWVISKPFMKAEIAEAHAPLNDVCEKCGRVYCDHENKY